MIMSCLDMDESATSMTVILVMAGTDATVEGNNFGVTRIASRYSANPVGSPKPLSQPSDGFRHKVSSCEQLLQIWANWS